MSKLLRVSACAALLASPAAMAGVTANVGAVSDYVFRGLTQSGGPAVQGGIDYESDIGIYVGTWGSNINFAGGVAGTEQDFYAGWGGEFGLFSVSAGLTYYWYPEEGEGSPGPDEFSTLEIGVSFGVGPVSLSIAHGPETNFFNGDGLAEEATYISLAYDQALTDSLTLGVAIGQYSGKEVERTLVSEDSYTDFTLALNKELEGGYSASFSYSFTDADAQTAFVGFDDDPKFIIGIGKSFDL